MKYVKQRIGNRRGKERIERERDSHHSLRSSVDDQGRRQVVEQGRREYAGRLHEWDSFLTTSPRKKTQEQTFGLD